MNTELLDQRQEAWLDAQRMERNSILGPDDDADEAPIQEFLDWYDNNVEGENEYLPTN